ncbi:MAG TPA: RES family NAD+ phosphorylase [Saprospiraceae bacterium]|nr:RES family NAD+ phosphorylase [Saprospiraceae bacterium]
MIVYRLSRSIHAGDLSGKGAEKNGGRWNSKGTALIYTSETRSLCMAEIAVHTPLGKMPDDYELYCIEFPDQIKIHELDLKILPADWNSIPHAHSTQKIGDAFTSDKKYLVMKVPSVIVMGEFNYLINPYHKDMAVVKIKTVEPFNFDSRIFR